MYAKLSFNADAVNDSQLVIDVINALLLGETVVANLVTNQGANLDTASCAIDTTYTTVAYTLYDDLVSGGKVYEIPVHDDGTQFFYWEIFPYNASEVHQRLWETWDKVSHTGTNQTYYQSSSSQLTNNSFNSTAPFNLYLSATVRHFFARTEYNGGQKYYFRGIFQWDRGEAWDTIAAGKKPAAITYGNSFATSPVYTLPHKRSDGAIYTLNSANLYLHTRYGNSQQDQLSVLIGGSSADARGLNAIGDSVHNMYEVGFSFLSSGERFLTGKLADVYLATYQNGGFGDIVSIGGNDYIIWELDTNYRMAVRKG